MSNILVQSIKQAEKLVNNGKHDDALSLLTDALETSVAKNDLKSRGDIFVLLGMIYRKRGEPDQASNYFNKAIKIAESICNDRILAEALRGKGVIQEMQGDYQEALQLYTQSLRLFHNIRDKTGIADVFNNIGIIFKSRGEYEAALEAFRSSVSIHEDLDNRIELGRCLNNIANIYRAKGDYEDALTEAQRAFALFQSQNYLVGRAAALHNIGSTQWSLGDYKRAIIAFQECIKNFQEINYKYGLAASLDSLGDVQRHLSDYDDAIRNFMRSNELFQKIDFKYGIGLTFCNLGETFWLKGDRAKAMDYLEKGIKIYEELGAQDENRLSALLLLSRIALERKDWKTSNFFFKKAKGFIEKTPSRIFQIRLALHEGFVALTADNLEQAETAYKKALDHAEVIKDSELVIQAVLGKMSCSLMQYRKIPSERYLQASQDGLQRIQELATGNYLPAIQIETHLLQARFDSINFAYDAAIQTLETAYDLAVEKDLLNYANRIQTMKEEFLNRKKNLESLSRSSSMDENLNEISEYIRKAQQILQTFRRK
ncbi:MAG: tetratricopeptide repeat protein [Candidatus Hodarchaeota archaeon]